MVKKDRVYTDQQRLFLDALIPCQGDIRAAMNIAGYSGQTAERYVIEPLYNEIVELTNKFLAGNAMKAAFGIHDVLTNGAQAGAANKLNAAKEILDRGGVTKKGSEEIKVPVGHGILILPAKQSDTPVYSGPSSAKHAITIPKEVEEDFGPFEIETTEVSLVNENGERLISEHRLIPMTEKEDF
jgi:hypothetical protein